MPKTFYNILFELLEIFEVVNNKAEKRRNFQKPILKKVIVNRKVLEEHPKKFGTFSRKTTTSICRRGGGKFGIYQNTE